MKRLAAKVGQIEYEIEQTKLREESYGVLNNPYEPTTSEQLSLSHEQKRSYEIPRDHFPENVYNSNNGGNFEQNNQIGGIGGGGSEVSQRGDEDDDVFRLGPEPGSTRSHLSHVSTLNLSLDLNGLTNSYGFAGNPGGKKSSKNWRYHAQLRLKNQAQEAQSQRAKSHSSRDTYSSGSQFYQNGSPSASPARDRMLRRSQSAGGLGLNNQSFSNGTPNYKKQKQTRGSGRQRRNGGAHRRGVQARGLTGLGSRNNHSSQGSRR